MKTKYISLIAICLLAGCVSEQPVKAPAPEIDFADVDAFLQAWGEADIDPNAPAKVIKPKPWQKPRKRVTQKPQARASIFTDSDIPILIQSIKDTGHKPIDIFSNDWLSYHPYEEPFEHLDFNSDGVTNLIDFAIMAGRSK